MIDIVAALESSFDEIHYLDFYREIFPEGSFEEKGVYEDGKYNGIAVAIEKGGKRTKRLTVTDDLKRRRVRNKERSSKNAGRTRD